MGELFNMSVALFVETTMHWCSVRYPNLIFMIRKDLPNERCKFET
jgi:hypothetical protein